RAQVFHLLFGSAGETTELRRMKEIAGSNCEVIAGVPLRVAAEMIRLCRLFVSNDSGLMHVAAAAGVPTIGLFGPTKSSGTSPRGEHAFIIRSSYPGLPCRGYPFEADNRSDCCRDGRCMEEITVETVMSFISRQEIL